MRQQFRPMIVIVCLLAGLAWPMRTAQARVRLENICTVYGQQEVHLTGLGLVVGLSGTGDGGKNLPTMRALAAALKLMNTPVLSTEELNNADNVAIVMVEATIPPTGLRRGQKIDCYVSSVMGAKSLRGGRLLVTPLETSNISDDTVVGLASGAVSIENATVSTTGVIKQGLVLEEDFISLFVDRERGHIVTLLLDEAHSSFHAASEVSRVIDSEFSFDAENQRLAHPVSPGVVEVTIPEQYHDSPVEFIAQVLEVGIDNPHTQARVIVNEKTQTIIVTRRSGNQPDFGDAWKPGCGSWRGP